MNLLPNINKSPLIIEIHNKKYINSNAKSISPTKKEDDKVYIQYRIALAKMKFRMEMDSNSSGTRRLILQRYGILKVFIHIFIF